MKTNQVSVSLSIPLNDYFGLSILLRSIQQLTWLKIITTCMLKCPYYPMKGT